MGNNLLPTKQVLKKGAIKGLIAGIAGTSSFVIIKTYIEPAIKNLIGK